MQANLTVKINVQRKWPTRKMTSQTIARQLDILEAFLRLGDNSEKGLTWNRTDW